eukprot:TRINITY_DN2435_c0_g1_i10.p1 TRINITY_DN2435_c0_g1~~TRINITY_DN2435_c0_g1_i10.p1  ORF type:complete len:535 (-),score=131.40 TRINITY_DN2435_c0_g1_i10:429-1961(-)
MAETGNATPSYMTTFEMAENADKLNVSTRTYRDTRDPTTEEKREIEISLYECGCLDEVERSLIKTVMEIPTENPPPILQKKPMPPKSPNIKKVTENSSAQPSPRKSRLQPQSLQHATPGEKSKGVLGVKASQSYASTHDVGPLSARETRKEKEAYLSKLVQDIDDSEYETDESSKSDSERASVLEDPMKEFHLPNIPINRRFIPGLQKKPVTFRLPRSYDPFTAKDESVSLPPIKMKLEFKKPEQMRRNPVFPKKGKVITKQVVEALIQKAVETQDVQYVKQVLELLREFDESLGEDWIWDVGELIVDEVKEAGFQHIDIHECENIPDDVREGLIQHNHGIVHQEHFSRRGVTEDVLEQRKRDERNAVRRMYKRRSQHHRVKEQKSSVPLKYGSCWFVSPEEWSSLAKDGTPRRKILKGKRDEMIELMTKVYSTRIFAEFISRNKFRTPRFLEGIDVKVLLAGDIVADPRSDPANGRPSTHGLSITNASGTSALADNISVTRDSDDEESN